MSSLSQVNMTVGNVRTGNISTGIYAKKKTLKKPSLTKKGGVISNNVSKESKKEFRYGDKLISTVVDKKQNKVVKILKKPNTKTSIFQNSFFTWKGQKERFSNVKDVFGIAINPFNRNRIIANVSSPIVKKTLETVANNPYMTALGVSALRQFGAPLSRALGRGIKNAPLGKIAKVGGLGALGYGAYNVSKGLEKAVQDRGISGIWKGDDDSSTISYTDEQGRPIVINLEGDNPPYTVVNQDKGLVSSGGNSTGTPTGTQNAGSSILDSLMAPITSTKGWIIPALIVGAIYINKR